MENVVFTFIAYVALLSASVERIMEFVKASTDVGSVIKDPKNKAFLYQVLTVLVGASLYYVSPLPDFPFSREYTSVVVGLLVSAGSGAWHDVLSVLTAYKSQFKIPTPPAAETKQPDQ